MSDANDLITAFVKEFDAEQPDVAKLLSYFSDDAVYHNIPIAPSVGKEAIEKALAGIGQMTSKGWEVTHQVASGNIVMNERIDRFEIGGKPVEALVCGVFEVEGDKIVAWRDYFDMAMFQKQMEG
jgi:limonene-1,2-epoxide hydrolase